MSVGVKKPKVTVIEISLELKLRTLMQISPGDPCPAEDCDGHIANVNFSWDLSGLDGYGECCVCLEKWTTLEVPSYRDALDEEDVVDKPIERKT